MALVVATGAAARDFMWTISSSPTNPLVNAGSPVYGPISIYLWYYSTNTVEGLAGAEFDIDTDGTLVDFWPTNGFWNAGDATHMRLSVLGCPFGPVVAGTWTFVDVMVGFCVCPIPSVDLGENVSVNCVYYLYYENDYIGFASNGSPPCSNIIVGSRGSSWGNVKSLYR